MIKIQEQLTQAWQQKTRWLLLLAPLAWLYGKIGKGRQWAYKMDWLTCYRAAVPVLVIGNITVGGSGKTPLLMTLVRHLSQKGVAVGVVSRGYGGASKQPTLVYKNSTPADVGDEPCLIVQSLGVPMAVGANRPKAVELLLSCYPKLQMIISDDGLQHYALYRDEEWIVVDEMRGFGNKKLLPQGFLREPITRLLSATVIHHCHKSDVDAYGNEPTMYLSPTLPVHLFDPNKVLAVQKNLVAQKVYALTGIGYPKRFFDTLGELGFDVVPCPKPDHHRFVKSDLEPLQDLPVVVTSKDAVKLRALAHNNVSYHHLLANCWVVPVEAVVSESVYALMDQFVQQWVK